MAGVLFDLKSHARKFHRKISLGDASAIVRIRRLDEFRDAPADQVAASVKRRHCLAVIARELGFQGWPHAVAVLDGTDAGDFGTLLYPDDARGHTNIWSASYDEAKAIHQQRGGYLLPYKQQFFIADRHFIKTLGLQPDDPDWDAIDHDWVRPRQVEARERLYRKLIERKMAA